jgi:hypothetical protein
MVNLLRLRRRRQKTEAGPCPKSDCKKERSGLDDDADADDAGPVKGFKEKKEADAGAVPGRVAVVGLPSASEPGKGNK